MYVNHQDLKIQTFLIEYTRLKRHYMDYIKLLELGDILLVQVYVDDIIFGSTKKKLCNAFEKLMHEKFQMSSMGELTFFLGLQVHQKKDGIFISQDKYVVEILKKFRFTKVKTASTPMETQKPLLKDENGKEVDVHMYRSMIGSLMYLTSSRPDIMFAVCACARYQVNLKVSHLHVVKRIFRYLKGQPKLGLWYPKDSPFDLVAYTDSDYAGASLDRKSITGGCQFLRCKLMSWQCKKQKVVANSTTKAEYVAASSCCGQVFWIQNQLLDYGEKKLIQMVKIYTDKNVADLIKAFDLYLILLGKTKKSVRLMMEKLFGMEFELILFWSTVKAKTINGEVQLHALVDDKKIIINESTVRRDLQLEDAEGVDCLPNSTIFKQLALMGAQTTAWNEFSSTMTSAIICLATNQKFNFSKYIFESMVRNLDNLFGKFLMYPRKPKRKDTQVPHPSDPMENVANEIVHKELGGSLMRAATIASSLEAEQDNGNITKTRSMATPNESSSLGTTSGGGPRCQETIGDTIAQTRVLDLEQTKTSQNNEIDSLKRRVKKLEKKDRSRTHKGRINAINTDEEITLVSVQDDADKEMFDVDALNGEEVFAAGQNENVVEEVVDAAKVSTVATIVTITTEEITLAHALKALKTSKPKDKGKGIMVEELVKPMKKKDLIRLDEEIASKLQAEFDEEERLAREKAEKEKEANIALIETWDDIQAKIDAEH
ncbi:uncharacterized mitochondrial protein-like protein [Tanacetum coccineum]